MVCSGDPCGEEDVQASVPSIELKENTMTIPQHAIMRQHSNGRTNQDMNRCNLGPDRSFHAKITPKIEMAVNTPTANN